VKKFLASKPDTSLITIKHIYEVAQISERTMQYAVKEYYGVAPKAYLKVRRLNRVRQHHWKADPTTERVNEIAYQHGFWHMGQFAADYKKLFRELPSDTLKNENSFNASSIGD
jgi:AraC family ethanolamine operon transcriptional activator